MTCRTEYDWHAGNWDWPGGFAENTQRTLRVAVVDFGIKCNILRCLVSTGCKVRVFPAETSARSLQDFRPDGVDLSNGPGDLATTGLYAVPLIRELLDMPDLPIFGICLGHQILALALGAITRR